MCVRMVLASMFPYLTSIPTTLNPEPYRITLVGHIPSASVIISPCPSSYRYSQRSCTQITLVGDVLLAAAFVSYSGAFSAEYRERLWKDIWKVESCSF